jgi:tRNA threonylcarbamoyladenosine biosynthesis protein TsaB
MTGLCIDTSGKMLTISLWDDGGIIAARSEEASCRHSDLMVEFMNSLLGPRGLSVTDIRAIAVTNGPGSFTGLRVGVAFAKGLAMGLGAKLLALNTLEALALSSSVGDVGLISPMLDAKKQQVYTALYDVSVFPARVILEPRAVEPGGWIANLPSGTAVLGSGAAAYRHLFMDAGRGGLRLLTEPEEPTAAGMIKLARRLMAEGKYIDAEKLDACYLRPADAKPKSGRK